MNNMKMVSAEWDKVSLAPRLRFPDFVGNWCTRPLGELAFIIKEKVGNRKCIPMSVTSGVGLIPQTDKFGREIAGQQYTNYIVLHNNDFAYNKSSTKDYPEGFIALYTGTEEAAVPNSIFTCFRLKRPYISPIYLSYLFFNNIHGKYLRKYLTVGARSHGALAIDDADLLSLPIPFPSATTSLKEQHRIADCLASLDARIASETDKLETLKAHKKGLLKQLFPAQGETLPKLRFPEFQSAGEWRKVQLSEIAIPVSERATVGNADVVLTLSADEGIVSQGAYFCKKIAGDDVTRYIKIKNNDFVYNDRTTKSYKYGTIKRLSRYSYGIVSPLYKCFRFNNEEIPHFWEWYFEAGVQDSQLYSVINEGAKSGRFNISIQKFLSIFVFFPDKLEQKRIAACLSSLDALITAQIQKIHLLKGHKKGLMEQLFPCIDEVGV